ncbi:hypothetical protein [Streptomyces sp. M54]|uniref:hypothetical protein n=1 Tax=Streptomyces sp. M54 TaxID=2759525 RepID=UPI001A8F0D4C|nr:hypothetical protein [Streptomyces sp. M54]QSS90899.1 hypothetical protein H3V39_10890 [Streptomyces sp. M54]
MRRGLVHVLAWTLSTGAAVTLSWWGVHTVLSGTLYDRPRAVPVSAGAGASQRAGQNSGPPLVSSTHRASPSPTGTPRTAEASPSAAAPRPARTPSAVPARPSAHSGPAGSSKAAGRPGVSGSSASGEVKSYRTDGGRVVFELGEDAAKLVSATPEPGWSMQVWTNDAWIRVDFGDGRGEDGTTYSVWCTWNGTQPMVQVVEP